jgi:hypothetical protein
MSELTTACTTCNTGVQQVFDPVAGTRQSQAIAGDLFVTERCFVRDEIRFISGGRLIFMGRPPRDPKPEDRERLEYFDSYYVICRKLTVIGGFNAGDNPDLQVRSNVITWKDRLQAATDGPNFFSDAADGPSFNGAWTDQGQGNDGLNGGTGTNGSKGNPGQPGRDAPKQVVVVALEVEMKPQGLVAGHLTIDWDGQDGGNGGRGQNGGKGGAAMNGRIGDSDTTWPGTGCDRQPGNGGNGGIGGNGGQGGDGGAGGRAGNIIVISTKENLTTGAFVNGSVSYIQDGGKGGAPGGTGVGGTGAPFGGFAGLPTSECSNASNGQPGQPGSPPPPFPPPLNVDPNAGAPGPNGTGPAGGPVYEEIQSATCADLLPLPMVFAPNKMNPDHFCRGFSLPTTGDGVITGSSLLQANGVTASLAGVTPTIKAFPAPTDTQLDLSLQIAGNSAIGPCNLTFTRDFGPNQTLNNAFTVGKFEVLTVTPNSGTKGNAVNVTITGTCFDPSSLIQQVLVSGLGVTVLNIVVVDAQTVQCVFDIAALTASGARDVTVKTGLFTHTLINAFTIN